MRLGADHSDTIATMNALARAYGADGKWNLAVPLLEESLQRQKANPGTDQSDLIYTVSRLANAYQATGKWDLAVPLLEETLKFKIAKQGTANFDTAVTRRALARAYQGAGKLDLAIPLYEEALKLSNSGLGSLTDPFNTINLAEAYFAQGKLDKALPHFEEAVRWSTARFGPDSPATMGRIAILAGAYAEAGETAKAVGLITDVRKRLPMDSLQLAGLLARVGESLLRAKAHKDAEPLLRECLTIREKTQANVYNTFNAQSMLGGSLLGQK
jgi:tetratricopeptide (TPR) repeat protein